MSEHNEEQEVVEKPTTHKKKAQAFLVFLLGALLVGLIVDIVAKSGGSEEKKEEKPRVAAVATADPVGVRSFDERVEDAKKRKAYEQQRAEVKAPVTATEVVAAAKQAQEQQRQSRLDWSPEQKEKTPAEIYLEAEQMRALESRRSRLVVNLNKEKGQPAIKSQNRSQVVQQPGGRDISGERAFIQDELARVRQMQEKLISGQSSAPAGPAGMFGQGQEPVTAKTSPNFEVGKPVVEQGQPKPGQVLLSTGTVISAALDQMTMSDVTGAFRAIVTRDVYDPTDTFVLIPKGAKLTGKSIRLKGVNEPIQNRMILTLNWCVLPNGKRISFEKTVAMDSAGVSALKDKVNYHLIPQVLGVAAYALLSSQSSYDGTGDAVNSSYEGEVGTAMREQFAPLAAKYLTLVPTVTLRAGTPMRVFIEDDLFITPWDRVYAGLVPRG